MGARARVELGRAWTLAGDRAEGTRGVRGLLDALEGRGMPAFRCSRRRRAELAAASLTARRG